MEDLMVFIHILQVMDFPSVPQQKTGIIWKSFATTTGLLLDSLGSTTNLHPYMQLTWQK